MNLLQKAWSHHNIGVLQLINYNNLPTTTMAALNLIANSNGNNLSSGRPGQVYSPQIYKIIGFSEFLS